MKSSFVFILVSTILGMATANKIDKQQLCTEVCWINDVNNHEGCKASCIASQASVSSYHFAIDGGLANKTRGLPRRKPVNVNRALTAVSTTISQKARTQFSMTSAVKAASPHTSRNTLLDAVRILTNTRNMCLDCLLEFVTVSVDTCIPLKRSYTPREQELQMSLDCADKCPGSSETCIQPCVREHAQSRAPGIIFSESVAVLSAEAELVISEVASTPTLNAGASNVTFPLIIVSSKARATSNPTTSANKVVVSDEQIPTGTAVTNSSSEVPLSKEEEKPARSHTSSATGQSYFENIWYWVHAAGTIAIALIIGLQVV
ncbi:hypothetical protein K440DRAFT_643745 [Wilcoxina mikolae CBS 423.85]|nr:hypothetical protein K440DRAFT_643745 [Wilcoxina mikolae CBS 423.85]